MKQYIESRVQTMIDEYRNNPRRIYSDYNREREAIDAYRGREILELIQNADDELLDGLPKAVKVSFSDNVLTVSNNGRPFSEEGIDSLMYSNLSAKTNKKNVIGNKGTGFRSILSWAQKIRIRSGKLSISFSHDYAQDILKRVILCEDSTDLTDCQAATLVLPKWLDEPSHSPYTTDISIHISDDEGIRQDIERQIANLNGELLLFLNRIESLIVETEGEEITFRKTSRNKSRVVLEEYRNDQVVNTQDWLMKRKEGTYNGQDYSVVTAYPVDGHIRNRQVLYAYFPTDVEFPFPLLLHANFRLNPDRNHLIKNDPANRLLLTEAAQLLMETALSLTGDCCNYSALKSVTQQGLLSNELEQYNFPEMLLEKIRRSRIFPTVNNEYISFLDDPIFYLQPIGWYVSGKEFSNLLQYTVDSDIRALIRKLSDQAQLLYPLNELVQRLNRWGRTHTAESGHIHDHVACIQAVILTYGREMTTTRSGNNLHLIFDQAGTKVTNRDTVFLRDSGNKVTPPPTFTKVRFMHQDMQDAFQTSMNVGIRELASILRLLNVNEYNSTRIIDQMNRRVRELQEGLKLSEAKKCADDALRWVWQNRDLFGKTNENLTIYFTNRNGMLMRSNELYLGAEYGNQVGENLLEKIAPNKFVCDIRSLLKLGKDYDQELTDFLMMLGMALLPKIQQKTVSLYRSGYKIKIAQSLVYPYSFDGAIFSNSEDFLSRTTNMEATISDIEDLEFILKHCDTRSILEWIMADQALSKILFIRREDKSSKIETLYDKKLQTRRLPLYNFYAYIYHQFETIPWIQSGDQRYRINECLLSKVHPDLASVLAEVDVSHYLEEGDKNRSKLKDEYEYHLKKLGVEDSFANLNVDTIYAVLNALPQIEGSEETARRLYAALIRSDRVFGDDELLRCEAYLKFKRSGLVLCRASYEPLSEAWYLSSRGISDKVAASYKLIELPRRMNSEKIQRLLGVSKLELKGEVYGEPRIHTLNPVFQTDYAKYKPMAYCYRLGKGTKEEARRFSQLTITLCESLTAKYNEAIADLADYDFIMDSPSHFYLQAPAKKDIDALKMDVNFSAAVSNVLCTLIDVGDVFPLFRELYGVSDASRQALILQMFEDPSILEQVKQEFDNTVDRRKEFLGVVAQLSGKSPSSIAKLVSGIDFRSFESVDSAPAMINCFRKLKIDVAAYNELSENSKIDLTEYYRSQITNVLYLKYKERYMLSRYNELKKKRLAEKKRLTRLFDHYRQIVVPIENSVYFDYEDAFVRQLSLHRNNPKINLIDLYHEHLEAWKAEDQTRRYVEAFLDEPENRSLVYFREFKALDQAYIEFLAMQEIEDDDSDGEELEENPHHDTSLELVEVELAALEPVASASQTAGKFSVLQKSTVSSSSKASVRTGERGEQLVYDLLKSNYPSVRWVSEYAKKARVNPEGRAGLGYDMEYVDEKGQRKFIEVKASKISDIAFYLSEPEMEFALKNNRDYAICFVADAETDKPRIMVLRDIIADGELDSGKFSVTVKKEYRLESRIVRQETVKKTQTEDDMTVSEAAIHDEGV